MSRIEQTFKQLKKSGRKALIPYIMTGDPSLDVTSKLIADLESAGADIIELGVPFSDPLADGPTIQRASERALQQGVTLRKVLDFVKKIRQTSQVPLILMTYYNPVFKFGIEAFAKEAADAGVDGLIIPDLIPDEADDFISAARRSKLDTIFLLAPTSTQERIKKVVKVSTGFIYYVSITGITGARLSIGGPMKDTLESVKGSTNKPVAVGFGISTPEEAAAVSKLADGVIVGSAIVRLIAEGKDVGEFVRNIKEAI
ncbi:MAG: tryptophan synthase subunit alpha [Nitrospiraceae bacterium]|nr:MAG: tryptophan synthase subunit alpha [Nitrospiraceae bacterium]